MANFTPPTLKILWGRAAGKCSMCKAELTQTAEAGNSYLVGQNAHIEGEKPGSARYSEDTEDRDGYSNLILLCPTCHNIIDKNNGADYSTQALHDIKKRHEEEIDDLLKRLVVSVSFAELEVLLSYLANNTKPTNDEDDLGLIAPKDKIKKNEISPEVENLLQIGLVQNRQIGDYLNKNPDMGFSDKVKDAFVAEYNHLKSDGFKGDSLYYALHEYARANHRELAYQTAAMTIVSYYFYLCEVFER